MLLLLFSIFPFKGSSYQFLSGNSWADDCGYHEVQSHDCLGLFTSKLALYPPPF